MSSTEYSQHNLRSVTITNVTSTASNSTQLRDGTTMYTHSSGTSTNSNTRNFAQNDENIPSRVKYHVSSSNGYSNEWGFDNPKVQNQNMDAGHKLPKSAGGYGDLEENIYGHNRDINRGWNGQYGTHRQHEKEFVSNARVSEKYSLQYKGYKS